CAAGLGWEVWLDGMEITQFTYFQQIGGLEASPVSVELTYGIERLASYIQDKENVFDLEWNNGTTVGDIFSQPEFEHSKYAFEESDTDMLFQDRKSTRLNSSHVSISYMCSLSLHDALPI